MNRCTQRNTVTWSTATPRSASSSSTSAFGPPEDVAGLVVYLASTPRPELRVAFRDGGWDADTIAEAFPSTVGERESVEVLAPKLPPAPDAPAPAQG
jgi:hypothetical protein